MQFWRNKKISMSFRNDCGDFHFLLYSRFRQLEEMRKAINRVVMRFAAFYASKEMLYGNSS